MQYYGVFREDRDIQPTYYVPNAPPTYSKQQEEESISSCHVRRPKYTAYFITYIQGCTNYIPDDNPRASPRCKQLQTNGVLLETARRENVPGMCHTLFRGGRRLYFFIGNENVRHLTRASGAPRTCNCSEQQQ